MGGEPGDDVGSNEGECTAPNSFSTVVADLSTFKTPPQLIQLQTGTEDEIGEEQPKIEQQKIHSISQIESEIANKSNAIGIIQKTTGNGNSNKITLKLPILQSNSMQFFECFVFFL